MKPRIIFILSIIILFSCQNDIQIIEGPISHPQFQFYSFYGVPEDKYPDYLDTLEVWKDEIKSKKIWFWEAINMDYIKFAENNDLLFTPCIFISDSSGNTFNSYRVYLKENDFKRINEEAMTNDSLDRTTWLEISVDSIGNNIFWCNKIISTYSKEKVMEYLDTLEEEIELMEPQYSMDEIEELYKKTDYGKNLEKIDSVFPRLEVYFREMDKGISPFYVFDDKTINNTQINQKEIKSFLKTLNDKFKRK